MEIKAIVIIDVDETNPKLCGKCKHKKGCNCWLYKVLDLKQDKTNGTFFRTTQCLVNK